MSRYERENDMKNTIIQKAIDTLTAQVELMECKGADTAGCNGAVNWEKLYHECFARLDEVQAKATQYANERDSFRLKWFTLDNEQARNAKTLETAVSELVKITKERDKLLRDRETGEYLKQMRAERDSWAQRFKGLEADMRGMETMLTDSRKGHERALVELNITKTANENCIAGIKDLKAQLDLKTRAASHLGKLHDEHMDIMEKQEDEIARLRAVLSAIQTACKG